MFILPHWYCHGGFGYGKMVTFTLKMFNIFCDVYTRDGTISLCQRDASAQIVVSHNYRTQVLGSILFTPSVVTKWPDRHRYLSVHHVPYVMSLSSPRHCNKTLKTNFSEILIEILTFSLKKMQLKMTPAKWCPFCLCLNMLIVKQWHGKFSDYPIDPSDKSHDAPMPYPTMHYFVTEMCTFL